MCIIKAIERQQRNGDKDMTKFANKEALIDRVAKNYPSRKNAEALCKLMMGYTSATGLENAWVINGWGYAPV